MIFLPKGKQYKIIEIDHALVICDPMVKMKAGQPLAMGDAGNMITYLDRYFWERENGADMNTAADAALKGCGFTQQLSAATGRGSLLVEPPFPKKAN